MTEAVRLDARRRGMLADMGIDVWVIRGNAAGVVEVPQSQTIVVPEPVPPAETKAPEKGPDVARLNDSAPSAAQQAKMPVPRRRPLEPPLADVATEIAVTCLTRPGALLLAYGREWTQAGRLGRDLLAAATGSWGSDSKRISFGWREPGDPSDGWRAFKAFADKQLADAEASVIFVNEALVDHLPERASSGTLVVLPNLAEFDTDAKRGLWTRIRNLGR